MAQGGVITVAPCPVCGASAPETTAFAPYVLQHCPACDLRFRRDLGPEWSADYDGPDGRYFARKRGELIGREDQRSLEAERRGAWVSTVASSGRLLEIGCAAGEFLDAAGRRGFEVSGIEASPELARLARDRWQVPVDQGLAEDRLPVDPEYDVVCMWHVLEHVASPVALLRAVARALKPTGSLFLEVPNVAAAGARVLRGSWPQLEFDSHATYFSPGALRSALSRGGLETVDLATVLAWEYLSGRERLRPRRIAGRAHRALAARTLRSRHPTSGDFLRAIARPSAA